MNSILQVELTGWTSTPRIPFVISGSPKGGSICLHTPTYSILLGVIGCCLGRVINPDEVKIGFQYSFDSVGKDLEKRQRLQLKHGKLKYHEDGGDVYVREFHVMPRLTLWLNRLDWEPYFLNPVGTPSLGRSQDILKIESVNKIEVTPVEEGYISGCMLPFHPNLQAGGQLVQLAEAYRENDEIGSGRTATKTAIFISIPHDNKASVKMPNLYQTKSDPVQHFYLHEFTS